MSRALAASSLGDRYSAWCERRGGTLVELQPRRTAPSCTMLAARRRPLILDRRSTIVARRLRHRSRQLPGATRARTDDSPCSTADPTSTPAMSAPCHGDRKRSPSIQPSPSRRVPSMMSAAVRTSKESVHLPAHRRRVDQLRSSSAESNACPADAAMLHRQLDVRHPEAALIDRLDERPDVSSAPLLAASRARRPPPSLAGRCRPAPRSLARSSYGERLRVDVRARPMDVRICHRPISRRPQIYRSRA